MMFNVALIGCGYWGSKLKKYIQETYGFQLKYICNSKSNLTSVWNDEQVAAIVVATPNDTHYFITRAALLHGKHVLVEKPLALRMEECEELKQIALDSNRMLFVEYTWTFSRGVRKAQDMIQEGGIGAVLGIEMAMRRLGRFQGGGAYWLEASHMLSILDMFVPLEDLLFRKTDLVIDNGEVETGVISFMNDTILGQIVVSLNYPGKETRVMIYGENGTIIFNPECQPSLQVEKYEKIRWTIASKLPRSSMNFHIDETNNLRYAMEYFHKALMGKAESNIDRAVTITKILEMLEEN